MTVWLVGQRFGRLVAIAPTAKRSQKSIIWQLRCDCGAIVERASRDLLHRDCTNTYHEGCALTPSTHPLFSTYNSMRQRCYNKNVPGYKNYGGRGITICDRWLNDFFAFALDMGPKPFPDASIDRINVNGNYEPSNCRWADDITQANNTRCPGTAYTDEQFKLCLFSSSAEDEQIAATIGCTKKTVMNIRYLDNTYWPEIKRILKVETKQEAKRLQLLNKLRQSNS